jgi:4-diphosphocytidyl-2-C-methyl-D-erythritol kinase
VPNRRSTSSSSSTSNASVQSHAVIFIEFVAGSARPQADVSLRDCLAPAKLNLFLHITGRRPDGYHALQTVFQLLDWGDRLHFTRRDDGVIARKTDVPGVPEADDLTVRAARLLQSTTGSPLGVDIEIDKILPMGAGLGGGSSDARTTLLALNRLWKRRSVARSVAGNCAEAGCRCAVLCLRKKCVCRRVSERRWRSVRSAETRFFLVVTPAVHVPTAAIFSEKSLTRDSKPLTIVRTSLHNIVLTQIGLTASAEMICRQLSLRSTRK